MLIYEILTMTNEKKRQIKITIFLIGVVFILLGCFSDLYHYNSGFSIAVAIWFLAVPILKIIGIDLMKSKDAINIEDNKKLNKKLILQFIILLVVFVVFWYVMIEIGNFTY